MRFGLNERAGAGRAPARDATRRPPPTALPSRDADTRKYRDEVAGLPDAGSADAYEATPVSEFGEALLRGMGWDGGEGAAITAYAPRPALLGLGAATGPSAAPTRRLKPGEAAARAAAAAAPAEAGVRVVGAPAPTPADRLTPGARGRVARGRHKGLACEVVAALPAAPGGPRRVRLRLLPSEAEAVVDEGDLAWGGEGRGEGRARDGADRRRRSRSRSRDRRDRRSRSRDRGRRSRSRDRDRDRKRSRRTPPPPPRPWLRPGIVVRVIDKRLAGGSLYLRRATVADVPSPGVATLSAVDAAGRARTLADVPQSALETALPKGEGGSVMVLAGEAAGRRGTLLRASTTARAAAVQLAGDLAVVRVALDDVAQYVGGEGVDE